MEENLNLSPEENPDNLNKDAVVEELDPKEGNPDDENVDEPNVDDPAEDKSEHWYDGVSEDNLSKIEKFKDIDSLAKSYVELESKMSKGLTEPETEEEFDKVYDSLGRPEDPDGYELEPLDESGQEMTDDYGKEAHKLGLSTKQAQGVYEWYVDELKAVQAERMNTRESTKKQLKDIWQGSYDENVELAKRGLNNIFSDEIVKNLDMYGFLDDKAFITSFYEVVKRFANDKINPDSSRINPNVERTESGTPMLSFPSMK